MPLFVPVLRLAMLFLNIYESYKILKPPPASLRNAARPSVRALTQRKRDMKGCLAVWTVWCCFTTYERFVESIISLFIPFYDEFKSMALLFLILTRARGAEPIYLHVIRPVLKPYTSTVDSALDLLRMIGDFLFALSTYPLLLAWERWHKTFGFGGEVSESETDSRSEQSNAVENPLPVPEYVVPAAIFPAQVVVGLGHPESDGLQFPKKVSSRRPQLSSDSRKPSGESSRSISHSRKMPEASTSQEHQIWYPPRSSYTEEDNTTGTSHITTAVNSQESAQSEITIVQEEVEEWRKYPPFPSAYPPTPIITTSRLMASSLKRTTNSSGTSLDPTLYPPIMEDVPQQDFHESLLPPRRPLNPGYTGDLSDDNTLGVQHIHTEIDDTAMAVDDHDDDNGSMSDEYEDEEEDDFDVTLRTPLPPLGSFRSHPPPVPPLPIERLSSIASSSAASRSTTLTTAAESSLHTRTSSESSLSGSASMTDSSSLPERKPLSPRTQTFGVKARVQKLESTYKENVAAARAAPKLTSGRRKTPLKRRRVSRQSRRISEAAPNQAGIASASTSGTADEVTEETTSSDASHGDDVDAESLNDSQKPPETKRRKVVVPHKRTVPAARPVRPRVTRYASPPSRSQQIKSAVEVPPAPTRASARLRSGVATRTSVTKTAAASTTASSANASQTSLSSTSGDKAAPAPPVRPKTTRKTSSNVASKAK